MVAGQLRQRVLSQHGRCALTRVTLPRFTRAAGRRRLLTSVYPPPSMGDKTSLMARCHGWRAGHTGCRQRHLQVLPEILLLRQAAAPQTVADVIVGR